MLELPKRDRRAERHQSTRAEILEAAWEACRADGLASLSLRDLANRVGMQAPSIYSYFASKHDIYDAMYAQGFEALAAEQPVPMHTLTTPADLKVIARYFANFCTADPVRYQLLFQRTIPGFEPSPESYALSVHSFEKMVDFFERTGLAVPGAIDMYTALLTGITDQQISNDPGGKRWTQLIDDAIDMFLAYLDSKKKAKKGSRK